MDHALLFLYLVNISLSIGITFVYLFIFAGFRWGLCLGPQFPKGCTAKAETNETCSTISRIPGGLKSSAESITLLASQPTDRGQPIFNRSKQEVEWKM